MTLRPNCGRSRGCCCLTADGGRCNDPGEEMNCADCADLC